MSNWFLATVLLLFVFESSFAQNNRSQGGTWTAPQIRNLPNPSRTTSQRPRVVDPKPGTRAAGGTVTKPVVRSKPIRLRDRGTGPAPANAKVTILDENSNSLPEYTTVSKSEHQKVPIRFDDQILSFKNRSLFIRVPKKIIPTNNQLETLQNQIRSQKLNQWKTEQAKKEAEEQKNIEKEVNTNGTTLVKPVAIPPVFEVPSFDELTPPVELNITFGDEKTSESFSLGPAKIDRITGIARLKVDPRIIEQIAIRHSQSTGFLNATFRGQKIYPDSQIERKIYFGGNPDFLAKNPALLVDFHGTINEGECTMNQLNHLISEKNINLFIISKTGFQVFHSVQQLGFTPENLKKVFVLGVEEELPVNAGRDKALVVTRRLTDSGAWILGIAGDSPELEGEAARYLGIPFFAVNQVDKALFRPKKIKKEWYSCESEVLTEPQLLKGTSCSENEKETVLAQVQCVDKYEVKPVDSFETEEQPDGTSKVVKKTVMMELPSEAHWETVPEGLSPRAYICKKGDTTSKFNPATFCSKVELVTRAAQIGADQKPFCIDPNSEVVLNIKEETIQENIGDYPSIDIQDYPEGSIYAHNWCELTNTMNEVILDGLPLVPFNQPEETQPKPKTETVEEPKTPVSNVITVGSKK